LRLSSLQDIEESIDSEERRTKLKEYCGEVADVSDGKACAHSSDVGEETGWCVPRHLANVDAWYSGGEFVLLFRSITNLYNPREYPHLLYLDL
jgi:hypothetical protein